MKTIEQLGQPAPLIVGGPVKGNKYVLIHDVTFTMPELMPGDHTPKWSITRNESAGPAFQVNR